MRDMPELLAPAGSADALYAAVAAGADAVYTGLGAFNARAAARDLDPEGLARACRVAHAHGARVYVTENVYMREGEFDAALDLARRVREAGADALIVADAGFARLLGEELPDLELHLSTQAGVMSAAGARLAANELGAARVTCARELSIPEISELAAAGVPVEVFCHGAICICYSGACAFSALRRGRSANRGDCTQPCRLAYRLEDEDGRDVSRLAGDRLLCPRDYLSVRHLDELARAGVAALKIEGRMKNPDYVYNVVRTYRAALDALASGDALDHDALEAQLGRSFNRGFTDAYLRGASGLELMSPERAINQGVRVGTVVERGRREVVVELTGAVEPGDTLEIRNELPADAAPDVPRRFPLVPCEAAGRPGERIRVHCKRRVGVGSPVHLTASARVLAEAACAVEGLRAEAAGVPQTPVRHGAAVRSAPAREIAPVRSAPGAQTAPALTVVAPTPADAVRLLGDARVDTVAVRAWRLADDRAWDDLLPRLSVILDEPCRAGDEGAVRRLCGSAASVVCRNLGAVEIARAAGAAFDVAAPVSATNARTVRWLVALGARTVWLPDELSLKEAGALAAAAPAASCGMLAYGAPQLMVCEHCLLAAEGPCDGRHAACPRRRQRRYLVGKDGARLPVAVDAHGRTRIFDAEPLDRAGSVFGLARVLVDLDAPGAAVPIW